ncbi:MAG: 50S ribosomal protein L1 [Parachlamydiales bacterium]|nr:50S ribosomal protein L1 [Parachlamydiales bacterium]
MKYKTKRKREIETLVGETKNYSIKDAVTLLKQCPKVKFDESVEVSLKLGVDPKKADQQVRGTVSLPHGTGKKITVLVFARGEKIKEALDAGADYAGYEEYIEKVKEGWTDFNAVIAMPDTMREVGKLGKILGPRGLMPTPKAGTVTNEVGKAVSEIKQGKIEYKIDKNALMNTVIGKLSFSPEKLEENLLTLLKAVQKAKPSSAKGIYMQSVALASTMGPGLKLDIQSLSM